MPTKNLQPKNQKRNNITLKKKAHISHSQIMNGRCLHKYKMINLLNKINPSSPAMVFGSTVHNIIYIYTKGCMEGAMEADFDLMNKLIDENFNKSGLSETMYQTFRETLLEFAEKGVNFDTLLDYEKRFHVNIGADDKPMYVDGIIDRINSYRDDRGSVIEIVDYKNSMNIMSEEDVKENLQLKIYRYIACNYEYQGYDYVRTGIYHTRYNYTRWTDLVKVSDLSTEFENTEKFLIRQWSRLIETPDDQYLPEKGEVCWEYGGCPVMLSEQCPLYKKSMVNKLKKGSIEDKIRAVRKIDIDRDMIIAELKDYFKTNEPMNVDGKDVGYQVSFSEKYPLLEFYNFANKLSLPLDGITISKTDVKKSLKKGIGEEEMSEEDAIELEGMRISTSSNRFKY